MDPENLNKMKHVAGFADTKATIQFDLGKEKHPYCSCVCHIHGYLTTSKSNVTIEPLLLYHIKGGG